MRCSTEIKLIRRLSLLLFEMMTFVNWQTVTAFNCFSTIYFFFCFQIWFLIKTRTTNTERMFIYSNGGRRCCWGVNGQLGPVVAIWVWFYRWMMFQACSSYMSASVRVYNFIQILCICSHSMDDSTFSRVLIAPCPLNRFIVHYSSVGYWCFFAKKKNCTQWKREGIWDNIDRKLNFL